MFHWQFCTRETVSSMWLASSWVVRSKVSYDALTSMIRRCLQANARGTFQCLRWCSDCEGRRFHVICVREKGGTTNLSSYWRQLRAMVWIDRMSLVWVWWFTFLSVMSVIIVYISKQSSLPYAACVQVTADTDELQSKICRVIQILGQVSSPHMPTQLSLMKICQQLIWQGTRND